jgi:hypothetical protein
MVNITLPQPPNKRRLTADETLDEKRRELISSLGEWRASRKHAARAKSVDAAIRLQATTKRHREAVQALLTPIVGGKHGQE